MNELILTDFDGLEVVDSRQVAEAIERPHNELLKKIRKYCEYLGEGKIPLTDFFIESTYISDQGKSLPCYLCTRKGCEMIANKLTGQKGIVFTALYVNAFHDMEQKIKHSPTFYSGKATSVGEVASLIKTLRGIMKDQKSDPEKIALMARGICEQFGIKLPEKFVEPKRWNGQLVLVGFKEN